jgi:hypothetical protein
MKNCISFPFSRTCLLATASLALLAGCGKKLTPDAEIKSIAYYMDHPDEREKMKGTCHEFIDGAYSVLTADEKEEAKKSAFLTNCNNVGIAGMNAYQQRLRDAAAKFSK